jgi:hypothetical protein
MRISRHHCQSSPPRLPIPMKFLTETVTPAVGIDPDATRKQLASGSQNPLFDRLVEAGSHVLPKSL